jgi:DNA invertase Pin-like site-specific DNA recombinase
MPYAELRRARKAVERANARLEKRIVDEYEAGMPALDIAQATGLARQTVYNILRRYGSELQHPKAV